MKVVCALLLGAVAVPAVGQMAPSRATAIVGAGRAGSWNTSIAVTNLDFYPLSIIITTTENNRAADCSLTSCNDYVNTTIPPHGTFILPSIPPPLNPNFSSEPQAFYVLSSLLQPAPAVSAFVSDEASACRRGFALWTAPFGAAFDWGDLYFPNVSGDIARHVNLLIVSDPGSARPLSIGVTALDGLGNALGSQSYEVTGTTPLFIIDLLRELGVSSLDGGSIQLSEFFIPNNFPVVSYAAALITVEPDRATSVQGTRLN